MQKNHAHHSHHESQTYWRLAAMAILSFIAMYILMYSMVDKFEDVYPSFNQFYMAALMAAPMVLIELALMGMMYKNKKLNLAIAVAGVVIGLCSFLAIRQQTAITDEQFLKSMIPHHSGAILMCQEAKLTSPDIQNLCRTIVEGQQQEIDQMRAILDKN